MPRVVTPETTTVQNATAADGGRVWEEGRAARSGDCTVTGESHARGRGVKGPLIFFSFANKIDTPDGRRGLSWGGEMALN